MCEFSTEMTTTFSIVWFENNTMRVFTIIICGDLELFFEEFEMGQE